MNLIFPQAGIITSLTVTEDKAKVFLPIYKIETDWIPIARSEWGTLEVGDEVAVIFLNGNLNDGRVIARF